MVIELKQHKVSMLWSPDKKRIKESWRISSKNTVLEFPKQQEQELHVVDNDAALVEFFDRAQYF